MRNVHGVEIKKGHWISGVGPRGGVVQGRIARVHSGPDAYVTLDDGRTVEVDSILQTLGPMTLEADGTVRQNPLTRVRIKSPPQRPAGNSSAPSKRLIKRRKATAKAPRGVYANPTVSEFEAAGFKPPTHYGDPNAREWFLIETKAPKEKRFRRHATFARVEEAKLYARALHNAHPNWTIRLSDER